MYRIIELFKITYQLNTGHKNTYLCSTFLITQTNYDSNLSRNTRYVITDTVHCSVRYCLAATASQLQTKSNSNFMY